MGRGGLVCMQYIPYLDQSIMPHQKILPCSCLHLVVLKWLSLRGYLRWRHNKSRCRLRHFYRIGLDDLVAYAPSPRTGPIKSLKNCSYTRSRTCGTEGSRFTPRPVGGGVANARYSIYPAGLLSVVGNCIAYRCIGVQAG